MSAFPGVDDREPVLNWALGERVKELRALYQIGDVLRLGSTIGVKPLQSVVDLLPAGFQFPDQAAARVCCHGIKAVSLGFSETPWTLSVPFRTGQGREGRVDVCYLNDVGNGAGDPFLPEERCLLETVAGMVRVWVERAEAVSELALERARLVEAQAVAKVGSWTTDLSTMEVGWSQETHRIFGTDPRTFKPTHAGFLALVHPDDRAKVDEAFAASLTQIAPQEVEHRVVVAGGSPTGPRKYVKERWQVIRDGRGRPVRATGTCQDVTEQKAAEADRLRSQRLQSIGNLAGGIAHDLNNVLAPILMAVELLKSEEDDPDRLETMRTIEESAQRGADLVRQVLTFARGREGQRAPVDLGVVMRDVARIVRETFPRAVALDVAIDPDVPPVTGDSTQLHQVLMNLVVNARDAMPDGGTLSLRLSQGVGDAGVPSVVMGVRDTGVGIPPDQQEQIFDPFFTTKDIGHGTGLGLSTVQRIVKAHEGRVTLSSEVGHGTTFEVWLPAAESGHDARVAAPVVGAPTGANEVVLVVDDEDNIRQVARKTLERAGYQVRLAANGAEAVEVYGQDPDAISVVVTDMSMPVMDGAEAIRLLRSINPHVCIVASSGLESRGGAEQALGTGPVRFLPKPYSAELLLRTIREAIDEA